MADKQKQENLVPMGALTLAADNRAIDVDGADLADDPEDVIADFTTHSGIINAGADSNVCVDVDKLCGTQQHTEKTASRFSEWQTRAKNAIGAAKSSWSKKPKDDDGAYQDFRSVDVETLQSAIVPEPITDVHILKPRTHWLTDLAVRRTWIMGGTLFLISLVLSIVAFAAFFPRVDLYENSTAFTIGNHPSVEAHKMAVAFYNVVVDSNQQVKNAMLDRRRDTPGYYADSKLPTRLVIAYRAKHGNNVLTAENLEKMRDLEEFLTSHPKYQKLCTRAGVSNQCLDPYSAVPYFFPSLRSDGTVVYDGQGDISPNLELTVQRLFTASAGGASYYFDPWANANRPTSSLVRSSFSFGQPGPGSRNYNEILDFLKSIRKDLRKFQTNDMSITWAQQDLLHEELTDALVHDALLVLVSVFIIFGFLWLLLGSLFLAVSALVTIILSMGLGYFVYRVVLQTTYFGAVNLLVIFVCLGIAVDDIFVVVNAFKQTKDMRFDGPQFENMSDEDRLRYRLGTSYRKSASAVFLTSFTTAAAVLTNLLSPLQGVRTFVLFMAVIVICCYVLTVTLFPCVIAIWARKFEDKPYVLTVIPLFPCVIVMRARMQGKMEKVAQRWPDITAVISEYLGSKHAVWFLSTCKKRAVVLLASLAVIIVGVVLVSQLRVNGGQLQILSNGNNYQNWIAVKDYYGNLLSDGANCPSCGYLQQQLASQSAQPVAINTAALADNSAWVPPVATSTTASTSVATATTSMAAATMPAVPDVPYTPKPATDSAPVAASVPASVPASAPATVTTYVPSNSAGGVGMSVSVSTSQTGQAAPPANPPSSVPAAMVDTTSGPVNCNSFAQTAASQVLSKCTDLFANAKCNTDCAMALDTAQTGWEKCKATQTTVSGTALDKVDWAIKNCQVEVPKVLNKNQMLRVYLTWGIKDYAYQKGMPKDEKYLRPVFDPNFDFYNPQTQMDMLSVCQYIINSRELSQDHPDAVRCFIVDFEKWLRERGLPFPLTGTRPQQSSLLREFLSRSSNLYYYVLWDIRNNMAHVGGVNVLVWTPRKMGEDSTTLYKYYNQWNNLIEQSNARSGPRFYGHQSAKDWEMMITKMSTVTGIVWSISLSALIAGLALLFFSMSPIITIFGMTCLVSNTLIVLGLVRIFGWTIGMLEALTLSILLGLAVDYLLHVGEEYVLIVNSNPRIDRYTAVSQALRGIGVSVIYSAITTCASVITLVFARLAMIQKMGLIIFAALILSIVISLFPFSALLASWGPLGYKRTGKRLIVCILGAGLLLLLTTAVLAIIHVAGVNIMGPTGKPLF